MYLDVLSDWRCAVTKRSKRTARVVQNNTWRDIAEPAVFAWFVQNVLDTVLTNRPFTLR